MKANRELCSEYQSALSSFHSSTSKAVSWSNDLFQPPTSTSCGRRLPRGLSLSSLTRTFPMRHVPRVVHVVVTTIVDPSEVEFLAHLGSEAPEPDTTSTGGSTPHTGAGASTPSEDVHGGGGGDGVGAAGSGSALGSTSGGGASAGVGGAVPLGGGGAAAGGGSSAGPPGDPSKSVNPCALLDAVLVLSRTGGSVARFADVTNAVGVSAGDNASGIWPAKDPGSGGLIALIADAARRELKGVAAGGGGGAAADVGSRGGTQRERVLPVCESRLSVTLGVKVRPCTLPIVTPLPKSTFWIGLKFNYFAEDDSVLRCVWTRVGFFWEKTSCSLCVVVCSMRWP